MSKAREMLALLGTYTGGKDPHGMLDQEVVDACNLLAKKEDLSALDIQFLIDKCATFSLCTDFVMMNLHLILAFRKVEIEYKTAKPSVEEIEKFH